MATITQTRARCRDNAGIRARRVVTIAGPASYATGGDPIAPRQLWLGMIEFFPSVIVLNAAGAAPRSVVYDYTNEKLRWFVTDTGAEVTATTDLSGYTFHVEVMGKG
jgi:acyl-CoA synthetase (AMP-forming)/AMP-acid ligase II